MPVRERVQQTYHSARPWLPAAFFFGGFIWDALTIGRRVTPVDLVFVLAYLAGAAAILVALGRGVVFRGSRYLNDILQFFFGGVFSALFIFYFLSSSSLPGYLVVMALGALLIGNEFLGNAYGRLTLSWAFFTLGAIMFFNFALAHVFRSISTFWFYLGTLVALAAVLGLRRVARQQLTTVAPSVAVAVMMIVLHVVNAIPPVPLVKKQMLIAHELRRTPEGYVAQVEPPSWRFWRSSAPEFHRAGGERVYCFTSVFVPREITTTIRHRWEHLDETTGEWRTTSVIPFRIAGGRETGYRGYTFKQNVTPGRWRVVAESESGAAIGIIAFEIVAGEAGELKTLRL